MYIILAILGVGQADGRFQAVAWGVGLDSQRAKRNCKRFMEKLEPGQKSKGWLLGKLPTKSHGICLAQSSAPGYGSQISWTREFRAKNASDDIEWLNLNGVRSLYDKIGYKCSALPPYTSSGLESL